MRRLAVKKARRIKKKKSSLQDGKLWRRPSSGTPVLCFTEVTFFQSNFSKNFQLPDGHMAINGHMGHIWPYGHRTICKKNMGKWGIPGKSYKNVAQQC